MIYARQTPPNDEQRSEPSQRRVRFSLRSLFVLMTFVALFCGWTLGQIRSRERLLASLRDRGVMVAADSPNRRFPAPMPVPWLTPAAWFKPVRAISVEHGKLSPAELDQLRKALPESEVGEVIYSIEILPDSLPAPFPNPS